jgi:hypothetical protein
LSTVGHHFAGGFAWLFPSFSPAQASALLSHHPRHILSPLKEAGEQLSSNAALFKEPVLVSFLFSMSFGFLFHLAFLNFFLKSR